MTLTAAQLAAALRLGDSTEETNEATRLLAYATEAVAKYADAPAATANEAAIRLASYLFDQPNAGRGVAFANALRNSGAAAILLPYRSHRAGSTATATAEAAAAPTPASPGDGIDAAAVRALIGQHGAEPSAHHNPPAGADLTAHAADANAHHTPPVSSYVLPAAAPGVRGGVQAVTNAVIDAGASTGIFGWALSHVRHLINSIVPTWARIGETDTIPAARFGADSIDHNALANTSVRRRHIDSEAVDLDKLAADVVARLLPAIGTNGQFLGVSAGAATWQAAPGGGGRWYEMAQLLTNSLADGTAEDMTLRPNGLTIYADEAAVRSAIANAEISMLVLQRSDSDAQVLGVIAPNFIGSATANYPIQFRFPNGEHVTVRFLTDAITLTPGFAITSTIRFDLGIFR